MSGGVDSSVAAARMVDAGHDVVGVHLVGGLVGTVGIGFLATGSGLFYGGGVMQLVVQVLVALFAMLWSAVATLVVGLGIASTLGWRVEVDDEVEGLDFVEHGEAAYDLQGATGARRGLTGAPVTTPSTPDRTNEGATA